MIQFTTLDLQNNEVEISKDHNQSAELFGDTAHIFPGIAAPQGLQIELLDQHLGEDQPRTADELMSLYVMDSLDITHSRPRKRGPGRPKKRGRKPKPKPDGRRKKLSGPITINENRDIDDAFQFANDLGRPLNTVIDIQPAHLIDYPKGDMGQWFRDIPLRRLAGFFSRQKLNGKTIGWHGIAIRENYEGERREHIHIICNCPEFLQPKLEKMLQKSMPSQGVVMVKPLKWAVHPETGKIYPSGLAYRKKQQCGNVGGPQRPGRPRAETHSRHDKSPVAPVFGQRVIISRSINLTARSEAGWQSDRDQWRQTRRVHYKAKRLDDLDRPLAPYQPSQP